MAAKRSGRIRPGAKPHPASGGRRVLAAHNQAAQQRGNVSARKVFEVLHDWLERAWILSYGEFPKWGYEDCILHQEGWFMALDGREVFFQIKSSQTGARQHLTQHADVPVIVVGGGASRAELDRQMCQQFRAWLPHGGLGLE